MLTMTTDQTTAQGYFDYRNEPGKEEAQFFRENGYLYIRGFYDYEREIEPIQRDIYHLIDVVTHEHGISLEREPFSRDSFDSGLPELLRTNRRLVGAIYDAVKRLTRYVRLATDQRHDAYARILFGTSFVGFANRGYGMRMDNPEEDRFLTQLHQDYVTQLCSQRGAVFWSPLRYTTLEMGPVRIYPGSHREGIFPIEKKSGGSAGLVIAHEDALRHRFAGMTPEVAVGDCTIIDYMLLHESTPNRSDRTRWSMISRFFDMDHESGRKIGWMGGLQEGHSFEEVHPELVTVEAPPAVSVAQ